MPGSRPLSRSLSRPLSRGLSGSDEAAPGPVNTVAPELTSDGVGDIGDTLTVTDGTWTTAGVISSYAYSWRRDGVPFGAANVSTYVLTADDDDLAITCRVTATDDYGSRSRTSNPLGPYNLVPDPGPALAWGDGASSSWGDGASNTWQSPS